MGDVRAVAGFVVTLVDLRHRRAIRPSSTASSSWSVTLSAPTAPAPLLTCGSAQPRASSPHRPWPRGRRPTCASSYHCRCQFQPARARARCVATAHRGTRMVARPYQQHQFGRPVESGWRADADHRLGSPRRPTALDRRPRGSASSSDHWSRFWSRPRATTPTPRPRRLRQPATAIILYKHHHRDPRADTVIHQQEDPSASRHSYHVSEHSSITKPRVGLTRSSFGSHSFSEYDVERDLARVRARQPHSRFMPCPRT